MSDAPGFMLALLSWSMVMSASPAAKGRLFLLRRRLTKKGACFSKPDTVSSIVHTAVGQDLRL